jgi:hypothetical protein
LPPLREQRGIDALIPLCAEPRHSSSALGWDSGLASCCRRVTLGPSGIDRKQPGAVHQGSGLRLPLLVRSFHERADGSPLCAIPGLEAQSLVDVASHARSSKSALGALRPGEQKGCRSDPDTSPTNQGVQCRPWLLSRKTVCEETGDSVVASSGVRGHLHGRSRQTDSRLQSQSEVPVEPFCSLRARGGGPDRVRHRF